MPGRAPSPGSPARFLAGPRAEAPSPAEPQAPGAPAGHPDPAPAASPAGASQAATLLGSGALDLAREDGRSAPDRVEEAEARAGQGGRALGPGAELARAAGGDGGARAGRGEAGRPGEARDLAQQVRCPLQSRCGGAPLQALPAHACSGGLGCLALAPRRGSLTVLPLEQAVCNHAVGRAWHAHVGSKMSEACNVLPESAP